MTQPLTAVRQTTCRCLVGTAAAVALCLSSCGGGAEGTDPSSRPDISPHKLVPVENDTAEVYIRGVVLCDTGWEIGSTPDDGPPNTGAMDDDETQLLLRFHSDHTFEMHVPYSEFVDSEAPTPTPQDWRRNPQNGHAQTREVQLTGGHWWQTYTADNTHNLIMGIYFEISDVGEDPALASDVNDPEHRNPSAIWTWQYRGENICLHLRERTNAPDAQLGQYVFEGYVASGTMTVNAQRNVVSTNFGGGQTDLMIQDTYNFWTQPATYLPGQQWAPPEDDPLKIKEQE